MAAFTLNSNPAYQSRLYSATSIGTLARDCIETNREGIIHGVTSRGIFIKTPSRWILFLSFESFPGPLSINVPSARDSVSELFAGGQVEISSERFFFQEGRLVITLHDAAVWQPSHTTTPVPGRDERIKSAAERIRDQARTGFSPVLLPYLMPGQQNKDFHQLPQRYRKTFKLLKESNEFRSTEAIIDLLGAGPGLTPSGDDVILGLLLTMNRWKHLISMSRNHDHFNQQIVAAAYQRTTTLSANLIECAAQELADRRLIKALDWLIAGTGNGIGVINELLTWGSSSGADAFVGFVIALSPGE